MGWLRVFCVLFLAGASGAQEIAVVRPVAAPLSLGAVGANLAAPVVLQPRVPGSGSVVSLLLPSPTILPISNAQLAPVDGVAGPATLAQAQGTAARVGRVASASDQVATELGATYDGSVARSELAEAVASPAAAQRNLSLIERLRVGTYNVLNLFSSVGKHVPDPAHPGKLKKVSDAVQKAEWQLREEARAILESDLDVVSLQEVENLAALEDFNKRFLGGRYRLFLIEGNDERGIDVAFLVKNDLPLEFDYQTNKGETWKDPVQGGREVPLFSRDLPVLTVRVPGSSEPLLIMVGTHYKSKRDRGGGDAESRGLRRAQVERTAKLITGLKARYGEDAPIMLAGDFNGAMNHEPEFEALRDIGMIDGFDALPNPPSEKDRVTHTYHPRGGATQAHQMDAVMMLKAMKALVMKAFVYRYTDAKGKVKALPGTYEERSGNPSDHFPVVVEMDFQPMLKRTRLADPIAR